MEAALRTAYFALSGEELKNADIEIVRGYDNAIVEATIPVPVRASRKFSAASASTRIAITSSK